MTSATAFRADLLAGRTILVTGATSGIGAACALALHAVGARVIASGRDEARLRAMSERLGDAPILAAALDQPGAAERLAAQALALGPVHGLVNSAGFGAVKSSKRFTEEEIDRHFAVNVRASMLLAIRISEAMKALGEGAIVNISSVQGLIGTPHSIAYAASKGAIDAMTRVLARELGPAGIRVNAVAPGLVASEMWGAALADAEFMEGAAQLTALRRWATPEMIAEVVLFLLSPASSYMTGEVVIVDGGLVRTGNLVPEQAFGRK
jgi:NAD(P)-dependent dehydrogenase (short-subunit alcohol dehydrogenase family)